jgi:hypothetical protein
MGKIRCLAVALDPLTVVQYTCNRCFRKGRRWDAYRSERCTSCFLNSQMWNIADMGKKKKEKKSSYFLKWTLFKSIVYLLWEFCEHLFHLTNQNPEVAPPPNSSKLKKLPIYYDSIMKRHSTFPFASGVLFKTLKQKTKQTPWHESASEPYRPSDLRLLAKLLPTFADRLCHVVSVTDPYCRILGFLE